MKRLSEVSKNSSKFLKVNGADLAYRVERRSVKYPRLEFKTTELLVVLPKSVKDETPLLEKKVNWIARKHEEIQKAIEKIKTQVKNDHGFLIFGDYFEIHEDGPLKIDFDEKQIRCNPKDQKQLRRLVNTLKKMLLYELELATGGYSKKLGVEFNRITVRKQRSKWGSCSSKGNLSFNLQLICLPRELIRYLACHEVAHLKEKNHSNAFWAIVKQEFENYKVMEKKLFEYWFFVQTVQSRFAW